MTRIAPLTLSAVILAFGACTADPPPSPGEAFNGAACTTDADCGQDLCTSIGRCYADGTFRAVRVSWGVDGQAASTASCAGLNNLELLLTESNGHGVTVGPLSCAEGLFTMERLPNGLDHATIEDETTGATTDTFPFTATGDVGFDLRF